MSSLMGQLPQSGMVPSTGVLLPGIGAAPSILAEIGLAAGGWLPQRQSARSQRNTGGGGQEPGQQGSRRGGSRERSERGTSVSSGDGNRPWDDRRWGDRDVRGGGGEGSGHRWGGNRNEPYPRMGRHDERGDGPRWGGGGRNNRDWDRQHQDGNRWRYRRSGRDYHGDHRHGNEEHEWHDDDNESRHDDDTHDDHQGPPQHDDKKDDGRNSSVSSSTPAPTPAKLDTPAPASVTDVPKSQDNQKSSVPDIVDAAAPEAQDAKSEPPPAAVTQSASALEDAVKDEMKTAPTAST